MAPFFVQLFTRGAAYSCLRYHERYEEEQKQAGLEQENERLKQQLALLQTSS